MKRELPRQEIDAPFGGSSSGPRPGRADVAPFDFLRLDRIPKSQIRAVHHLHENFIRETASSLSAYLRTNVTMNLASLEQISYEEFLERLTTPTFLAYVGTRPYDATVVMEITPGLAFAVVEILLGGGVRPGSNPGRKITEVERELLQNLTRLLLRGLREAWNMVTDIEFEVQSVADEPYVIHVMTPGEAVVAIGMEVRIGGATEMINLAFPSIFIKQLRFLFDRVRRVQRAEPKSQERLRMAQLLRGVGMDIDVRLENNWVLTGDLLGVRPGDVLLLQQHAGTAVTARVNGRPRYTGHLVQSGTRAAFEIAEGL